MTDPTRTSRSAIGMGAIAAASRAVGFVRVLVVAGVLGTTYLGNAFQAANSVSNVLFELLAAGALSAVLVPTFVELFDAGDDEGVEAVAGGVLGVALGLLGALSLLGILGAPLIARLLTLGVPASVAAEQRELTTFLLRFFVPQVMLYAAGTVATAVLYARRRFAITAAAPIGNTVVMVVCLLAFQAATGSDQGLDLTSGQRWWLVAAGTGGVMAFVGLLLLACRASGFRLRPRLPGHDGRVQAVLRHAGWGVVLHTGAGLLLGGAIVAGSAVEGAVVAYQVAWVFFLAPYAILAQPIHTAILPELVAEARDDDLARFRASIRWSLERMALLLLPVSGLVVALALPAMRVVSFGAVSVEGPSLLAAALAALAVGLLPYGAFLLLARAYYALGDSRTPGITALASCAAGVAIMATGALATHGAARVAMLGAGHSVAYAIGSLVLLRGLGVRLAGPVWPAGLTRAAGLTGLVSALTWWAARRVIDADTQRVTGALTVAVLALVAGLAILLAQRVLGFHAGLTRRAPVIAADPLVLDDAPEVLP